MPHLLNLKLTYEGEEADDGQLDFYDTAQALIGFERSLALTTHLVLNGKIITQAPSLKGAKIYVVPPEEGSWTIIAGIVTLGAAGVYKLGTAPRDTPLGNLVSSAYEYVILRTLGFVIDYDQTLGQQYQQVKSYDADIGEITPERMDSLIEKTETAIKQMHRPIVESKSASEAKILAITKSLTRPIGRTLTQETFERIELTERSRVASFDGRVSSYNMNTYRGRIYIDDEQRPIPFELADGARDPDSVATITSSLAQNATNHDRTSDISFLAFQILSNTGRLKSLVITEVE